MNHWTAEEDKILIAHWLTDKLRALELLPYRSYKACSLRMGRLSSSGFKPKAVPAVKPRRVKELDAPLNLRRCHDCKALTTDYRCPKCLAKWRRKNHVAPTTNAQGMSDDSVMWGG